MKATTKKGLSFAVMMALCCGVVAGYEGVSLTPYQDIGGVWTICHGETAGITKYSPTQTPESCSDMLKAKLMIVGWQVDRLVDPPMSESRWAALTSFSYNVGTGSFSRSTLLKKLNVSDPKACDELLRWTYVKGRDCRDAANKCRGIVRRREKERELCLK